MPFDVFFPNNVIKTDFVIQILDFVRQYSTAMLPCFAVTNSTLRIQWYKGSRTDISHRILYYNVNSDSIVYLNGHSADKYSCNAEGVLSISDVQISDEMKYSCEPIPYIETSLIMMLVLGKADL